MPLSSDHYACNTFQIIEQGHTRRFRLKVDHVSNTRKGRGGKGGNSGYSQNHSTTQRRKRRLLLTELEQLEHRFPRSCHDRKEPHNLADQSFLTYSHSDVLVVFPHLGALSQVPETVARRWMPHSSPTATLPAPCSTTCHPCVIHLSCRTSEAKLEKEILDPHRAINFRRWKTGLSRWGMVERKCHRAVVMDNALPEVWGCFIGLVAKFWILGRREMREGKLGCGSA